MYFIQRILSITAIVTNSYINISLLLLTFSVGDTAGVIGDNVDNDAVGVVCDVVKEQAEADDDTTMGQRLGMATGTVLQGTSGMVDNEIAAGEIYLNTCTV